MDAANWHIYPSHIYYHQLSGVIPYGRFASCYVYMGDSCTYIIFYPCANLMEKGCPKLYQCQLITQTNHLIFHCFCESVNSKIYVTIHTAVTYKLIKTGTGVNCNHILLLFSHAIHKSPVFINNIWCLLATYY